MNRFVVDASIALAWCFDDEGDTYAESVLKCIPSHRLLVPSLWSLEVSNALLMSERKGRTQSADTARAVALLEALPIDTDERTSVKAMNEILFLARAYKLTAYDASYLELSLREGVPIATLDDDLRSACKKANATVFQADVSSL